MRIGRMVFAIFLYALYSYRCYPRIEGTGFTLEFDG